MLANQTTVWLTYLGLVVERAGVGLAGDERVDLVVDGQLGVWEPAAWEQAAWEPAAWEPAAWELVARGVVVCDGKWAAADWVLSVVIPTFDKDL